MNDSELPYNETQPLQDVLDVAGLIATALVRLRSREPARAQAVRPDVTGPRDGGERVDFTSGGNRAFIEASPRTSVNPR